MNMKTKTLKSMANLSTGITFRSRFEASAEKDKGISVVRMRDLSNISVNLRTVTKFDFKPPKGASFLEFGDILFRSRGETTTAVVVPRGIGKAVLASPLFLVRVKNKSVILPEYLCWYINQRPAQRFLFERTEGTLLKMISLKHLEELEIPLPLPSLSLQKTIAKTALLLAQEVNLMKKIKQKRMKYINTVLMRLASKPLKSPATSTLQREL